MLPLLAVALAVPPKRSSSGVGVFLSIVMVVSYYKVSEYAAGMGALGLFDPFLALWIPFGVFSALILWMFYVLAYVPGGQPIGGLERWTGKAFGVLRSLFVRKKASS
jgi:lipopolysaccharide export system permease protein